MTGTRCGCRTDRVDTHLLTEFAPPLELITHPSRLLGHKGAAFNCRKRLAGLRG
ncbi:hypothetical protein [Streptomyces mirabilis]|uniref:hypothetical protein n=1 Tax=Streptomyces mirabilis TaxID=68239 RepID=UPI0032536920